MILNIVLWIIVGGLAGWIAGIIMKSKGGLLRNIIIGIVGALLAGWILSWFGVDYKTFSIIGFVAAIAGAALLISLGHLIFK